MQLSLWDETPAPSHQLIEVVYEGGKREVYCSQGKKQPDRNRWQIYAGYMGGPVPPEQCTVCLLASQGQLV